MDAKEVALNVLFVLYRALLAYASLCLVVPLVSCYQEYKIWQPKALPSLSLYGILKVYLFNVLWTGCCLIGAILLFPKWLLTGNVEHEAHVWVERNLSRLCLGAFVGPVEVVGTENLPSDTPGSPAPIYIANHASQIDVGVVYNLHRRFKWIAKASVMFLPGVGQIMFLSNHVFINRKTGQNKSSVNTLYEKSNEAIRSGLPMFFFPQGTRRMSEQLPFKDGAFNIAIENKSTLVPVSINVPMDAWNKAYPLSGLWGGAKPDPVVLTVHKPIPIKGNEDKEVLKKQCFDIIYSVLPKIGGDDKKEK